MRVVVAAILLFSSLSLSESTSLRYTIEVHGNVRIESAIQPIDWGVTYNVTKLNEKMTEIKVEDTGTAFTLAYP